MWQEEAATMGMSEDSIGRIEYGVAVLVRLAELARAEKPEHDRLVRSAYLLLGELQASGPRSTAVLASAMGVDISTASRQIAPLEEQGLVARLPKPGDRRSTLVEITPLGVERLEVARRERRSSYAALLAEWTPEQREELADGLERLNTAIAGARLKPVQSPA
jgi:DNA-binding MarR family transcriptional regulator